MKHEESLIKTLKLRLSNFAIRFVPDQTTSTNMGNPLSAHRESTDDSRSWERVAPTINESFAAGSESPARRNYSINEVLLHRVRNIQPSIMPMNAVVAGATAGFVKAKTFLSQFSVKRLFSWLTESGEYLLTLLQQL